MAEKKKEGPKMVRYIVPRDRMRGSDITVGVNGKVWKIRRGVPVMIPDFVADVIDNSLMQDAHTDDLIAEYGRTADF